MTTEQKTPLDCWGIVEVMGHHRYAGKITETTLAGTAFIRVDVPETVCRSVTAPAFTKYLGSGAIFALTPTTEETARQAAVQCDRLPVELYGIPQLIPHRPALAGPEGTEAAAVQIDPTLRTITEEDGGAITEDDGNPNEYYYDLDDINCGGP